MILANKLGVVFRLALMWPIVVSAAYAQQPLLQITSPAKRTSRSVLRPEPTAGKKFSGGALAAGDGTVQCPVVSAAIRRFSGKEQSIPNRCT